MKKKIIGVCFLLITFTSFSEITLELDTTLEKVVEKSETIKKYKIDLENAKLQKKEAFKSGLPKINEK